MRSQVAFFELSDPSIDGIATPSGKLLLPRLLKRGVNRVDLLLCMQELHACDACTMVH